MSSRLASLIVSGACALLLVGCSSSEPTADAPSVDVTSIAPTPSETPSATPTPTPISREEAGAQYLALVAPVNAGIESWNAAVNAPDYPAMRTLATERATTYRTFADGLIAAKWPPEAQGAVDRLVTELAGDVGMFVQVAASATDAETNAALAASPPRGPAAQELRMLLGLDNIPAG